MIARLEVTRGDLTEFPLAEKTRGGWQNGVTFYPDAEVTKVKPVRVRHVYPDGAPTDDIWKLIDDTNDWAEYLDGESEPDSNDAYNAQEFRKLTGLLQRLVDERDALIAIRDAVNAIKGA